MTIYIFEYHPEKNRVHVTVNMPDCHMERKIATIRDPWSKNPILVLWFPYGFNGVQKIMDEWHKMKQYTP